MPAWMTPDERLVWWAPIRGSRSSTAARMPSWRRASSRATAKPTIPAPMTTASHSRGGSATRRSYDQVVGSKLVALPLKPPVKPQLARSRSELPTGEGWAYEPKYDGFRAIAFVDGDEVELQSRGGKSLTRYFPELHFEPGSYVLDGEIVVAAGAHEDFDALGQRIHPAASRI